jgi:hypothetical protein
LIRTLQEEEDTDSLVTHIAERNINVKAEQEGSYKWEKKDNTDKPSLPQQ